jgi:prepilin-type N-terminal cleavage/methylation domain-containing protein
MRNNRNGFTLIELLIVVAIIAILAAIAIPNFLAAQVRAKVSRVKAELRTIGTGMESYYVDNNAYPHEFLFTDNPGSEQARNLLVYRQLTTPIAYITSAPRDPFKAGMTDGTAWRNSPYYWYYNWLERYGQPINPYPGSDCPWYNMPVSVIITSIGPAFTPAWPMIYDPSNGTSSNGNLTRICPGGQIN